MNVSTLARYRDSVEHASDYLLSALDDKGSLGQEADDIASYYKIPYLLYTNGKTVAASRTIDFIAERFMLPTGDFANSPKEKTQEPVLKAFPTYVNAWLAISAQKMNRFEIAYPAYKYLRDFYHPEQGGFVTERPYGQGDDALDVFTTAHLGMVSLMGGDLGKAKRAGNFLQCAYSMQPDLNSGFYLRLGSDGRHITSFDEAESKYYLIHGNQPDQFFFVLGYIVGFLAKLYSATDDESYLSNAKAYVEILNRCHSSVFQTRLSNQVGPVL